MAYPVGNTWPITQLLINGTWTDISSYVRQADNGRITITRGRSSEQANISPQSSDFTLNNRDGRFSNRNPNSPYYGLLPRNTQVRHFAGAATSDDTYLYIPYNDRPGFNGSRTVDKAVLDITGDIEVRVDIWPHTWRPGTRDSGSTSMILASKFDASNQESWVLYLRDDGTLRFGWSSTGADAARITATSTAAIPVTTKRLSIKVTLDVNNGAAGNTVTFATAATIGGSYTTLGSPVITAGVTSIFNSTANLCVGCGSASGGIFVDGSNFGGKFYELRVYNGIGGTLVANPIYSGQTVGTTSFSDGLGTPNTWLTTDVSGTNRARITSDRLRFWGELSSLPQKWDITGTDVYVPVSAAGILRRLTQGADPIRSAMYRRFLLTAPDSYWPLEDSTGATTVASAVVSGRAAILSNVSFDSSDDLPGAERVASFTDSSGYILFTPKRVAATGTLMCTFYMKLTSSASASLSSPLALNTTGTVKRITVGLDTGAWHIKHFDADGAVLLDQTGAIVTGDDPQGHWIGVNILLTTSGGNVQSSVRWQTIGTDTAGIVGVGPTVVTAGTVGAWSGAKFANGVVSELQTMSMSHFALHSSDYGFVSSETIDASNAYAGELAAYRFDRLCREEDVTAEVIGYWDHSTPMGPQAVDTLVNNLQDCATVDGGIFSECEDALSLRYRVRADLGRRRDLELDYDANVLSVVPEPTEDDIAAANDVTVTRPNGSSYRYIVEEGSMSIQESPDGIGRYAVAVARNAARDDELEDHAGWLAHAGTWDEARYPNLAVSLHRTVFTGDTTLTGQAMSINLGDTIALVDIPAWLPPDDVLLLVQGYTETLGRFLWDIAWNTTPAGIYRTGVYDEKSINNGSSGDYSRYDVASSSTNASHTSSTTTLVLKFTDVGWTTDSSMYPFDIMIGGERITLNTAPAGATSPQTFTGVTRSVNGIVKAHAADVEAHLFDPTFYDF